ncbi:MAG: endonuclease/exonuclease/phosphatase family protein [Nocardioides sp.]|uniref:endonuclease/exonuclease/phosphatase family protein n=1 Tax=Nocardioides sp. TaxID=35761 RepID=UPI0039E390A6
MRNSPLPALARPRVIVLLAVVLLLGLVSAANGPGGSATRADTTRADTTLAASTTSTIRVVQANLRSPQSVAHFQADVKTVLAQKPDIITYNEVAHRNDAVLAPGSYDMFRTPGQYTGETAVAWNSKVWTAVATGTQMISNSSLKTKRQKVKLGMRYANWATLQSTDGRVVSVVSVHTPPKEYPVKRFLVPSIKRTAALVAKLGASGPVIIGGDFNMQYHGARYAKGVLASADMTPTFDVLGSSMATHDGGGTIDYVFLHSAAQFTVADQYTKELHSDHDLLGVDLALAGTTTNTGIVAGTLTNNPASNPRAVVSRIIRTLNSAPQGSAVHLATRSIQGSTLVRAILNADARGVKVQVLTGDRKPNAAERKLAKVLGTRVSARRWAVNRPHGYLRQKLPAAVLLASESAGTAAVTQRMNRPLVLASQQLTTRLVTTTTVSAYDPYFVKFFAAVGRSV